MAQLLGEAGYAAVDDARKASVLIVNTCGFIGSAREESVQNLRELAESKKRNQILVAAGCLSQIWGQKLVQEVPGLDGIIGTRRWMDIVEFVEQVRGRRTPAPMYHLPHEATVAGVAVSGADERGVRRVAVQGASAYVKIAEGCSKACTFCTVPRIRGPYRSRRLRSILEEAKQLGDQGVQELILIAQDTTTYGEDLKDGTNLEKLLRVLVRVDGVRWIRMLYSYPRTRYFTDGLLETMAQEKTICPYLDLPIQHIDDEILKRMGRRVKSSEIRNLIHKIKTFLPHISLRTSLIVGFPGESQDQFQALLNFVKEVEFDHLGAFKYSSEEGTPASRLSSQIPGRVKEKRLEKLMNLQKKISLKKCRSLVGEKVEVLVESAGSSQGNGKGRLQTQAPEIDGSVILEGRAHPGDWVEAQIIKAFPYDVLGRIERHL